MANLENISVKNAIAVPEQLTEEQIAILASNQSSNFFRETGLQFGVVDSPLKVLDQLETENVIMRLLHIDTVHMTRAVDDNGQVKDFPIMRFVEYPTGYYQGGGRLNDIVIAWAKAAGDNIEYDSAGTFSGDRMLPYLNKLLGTEQPGIVLKWRTGKKNKYVDVIVL